MTDDERLIEHFQEKVENLEEGNKILRDNVEALENALDDIQHYLGLIKDVFYDLNKQDIYRNNF